MVIDICVIFGVGAFVFAVGVYTGYFISNRGGK